MVDLNELPLAELYTELARNGLVMRLFELARDEDFGPAFERGGGGDVTGRATFGATEMGEAAVVFRQAGVLAGSAAMETLLHALRADADYQVLVEDGTAVAAGATVGRLRGNLRAIVAAERTVLNTLGRLSGVATRTAEFVAAVKGTKAQILDTRKTTPGMRVLEKYAVRCGGGHCHRIGLYDAALIKDNHLAGLPVGELAAAVAKMARRAHDQADREGLRFVGVEVDRLDQLEAILAAGGAGAGMVLLDNMGVAELREAVAMRDRLVGAVLLEASGGIGIENVRAVAETGVDRISLGTLTHGARWVDVGLDRG